MEKSVQIDNARRIDAYLSSKSTQMADAIYRNPVSQYTCRDRLDAEKIGLFRRYPLHLAFSCEMSEPGDFMTDDFSGVPILLVRGNDGRINAFLNVCRHRGAPVADGCGKGKPHFVCPYHAWVYGIDGSLEFVPGEEGFEGIEKALHGLTPLPVQEKYGMIWAMMQPGPDFEIDDYLGGLVADLSSYGFCDFHHYETRELSPRMNWKLVVDTFLESYHIRTLHRNSIAPLIESNVSTFDALGNNLRTIYVRKNYGEMASLPEDRWSLIPYTTIVYVLFPNTVLVVQQEQVETWRIYPDENDPNLAKMHVSLYTPEPVLTERAERHWANNMNLLIRVVDQEDFPLGERMQVGFHSAAQRHITFGRNEPALGHFHRRLDEVVLATA